MDTTETAIATSTDATPTPATAESVAWTRFPCDWSRPPAPVAQSLNAPHGISADPLFCNAHKVVAWSVPLAILRMGFRPRTHMKGSLASAMFD